MFTCSVMEFPSSSSPELVLPSLVSLAGAAACAATSLDSAADSGIFVSAKKLQYELRLKEQRLTELVNVRALVWEVPSLIPMYDLGLRSSRPKCWVTWLEIILLFFYFLLFFVLFLFFIFYFFLYYAQLHPSSPITICRACFFWSKIIERDIYYTFIPLVSSHHRERERGLLHIHAACFVSWCFKERYINTHFLFNKN